MTETQDSGDIEHAQVRNLAAAAATFAPAARRGARRSGGGTPRPGVGAPLKQMLLVLRGGVQLAEHDAPRVRPSRSCRAGCGW